MMTIFYAIIVLASTLIGIWSLVALRSGRGRRHAMIVLLSCAVAGVGGWGLYSEDATSPDPKVQTSTSASGSSAMSANVSGAGDSRGVARVCLIDNDITFVGFADLKLPATTVLEDAGELQGTRDDPSSWTYTPADQRAAIITLEPIVFTRAGRCADVKVKMLLTSSWDHRSQRASENHVFTINDVREYPIPARKPPVEIGKLIDNLSVKAIITSDVDAAMKDDDGPDNEASRAAKCLEGAQKLAAFVGGGIGRQTSSVVFLNRVAAKEASYGCPTGSKTSPNLFVSWDGHASPPPSTMAFIKTAGEYLTGATQTELRDETATCVDEAQKPDADEAANREVRGVRLECQAFARDGGGGAITVYRRFGTAPMRPEMDPTVRDAMERTSAAAKIEDQRKASAALQFAQWWRDPTIPEEVKSFAMVTARMVSLTERCPTATLNEARIDREANAAGIELADLQPGGKYAALMAGMLRAMRTGAATESVETACEAAKKYE